MTNRYDNDKRYALHEWEDETSPSDPKGRWIGGCEYYSRTYKARVPRRMLEEANKSGNFDKITDWIERNSEKPIWR